MSFWIRKLKTWLSRGRVTIIFGAIYFVSQVSIGLILGSIGPDMVLRLQTSFSAETFVQIIEQWKAAGILHSYLQHFYLDFPHPIWYSVFLASLLARGLHTNNIGNRFDFLVLIPFVAGASDLIENVFHLYLLSDIANISAPLVFVSALFCNLKWLLSGLSLLIVAVLAIRSLSLKTTR